MSAPSRAVPQPQPQPPAPTRDDYLRYLDTLRDLGIQGHRVNTALLEAHTADGPAAQWAALSELHTRLRRMAATANHALGGWPTQDEGPQ